MTRLMLAGAIALLLGAVTARATTVEVYGNYVKDASNTLVSGTRTVTLTIYDASTGGTSQWSQTYTGVSFTDGVFSMENTNLPSMYFDAGYYLALTVSSTGLSEILPRALLSSSKKSGSANVEFDLIVF